MKNMKMLGLLAVAVAAMSSVAGTASATELTSPKGTKVVVGTKMKAEAVGPISLTGTITITCQKASGEGELTNAGGPGKPVEGVPVFTNISECGSSTITTLQKGTASRKHWRKQRHSVFDEHRSNSALAQSFSWDNSLHLQKQRNSLWNG